MPIWKLASPWGILRTAQADAVDSAWHAGRLFDVLRVGSTPGSPLLVANDGSGVWIVDASGGPAIPLSTTWPAPGVWSGATPNVACLAQGIDSPEHVYAGGASLSETDTTHLAPLFNWRDIPIGDADGHPLNAGFINRMLVVSQRRKLVLACDNGVFTATIPSPGGTYVFTREALPGLRFSGLAEGPDAAIIAGAWGTDQTNHFGIFIGILDGPAGALIWRRATVHGVNPRSMRRVDLASCATDRTVLYAVCGGGNNVTPVTDPKGNVVLDPFGNIKWANDNDFILAALKSTDGGRTWRPTGTAVAGQTLPFFPGNPASDLAGHTQDGYIGCVGVSPFDPNQVAIGVGPFFLSRDGGANWERFTDATNVHLHTDTHALVFDPTTQGTLHIGSDGGLATTPDLGTTWRSTSNRQLPNLEIYSFSASPKDAGLIAASLQDNGNVYAPLYIATDPWTDADGGDGVMSMFIGSGELMRQNNTRTQVDATGTLVEYGEKARASRWDATERRFHDLAIFPNPPLSLGVVPVDGTGDGLTIPTNAAGDGGATPPGVELLEAVSIPTFANAQGEPMVAVGASALAVFGMFAVPDGTFHWQQLGTIPSLPDKDKFGNPLPYLATAVATVPDGTAVFVGTNTGKVFRLDLNAAGSPVANLSDVTLATQVTRFVAFAADRVFLIAGGGVFHRDGTRWALLPGKVLPGGVSATLPVGQQFNALAADPTTVPPTLYVATASQIFRSEDSGDTWFDFTGDLPKAPSCNDLRWVQESSGATFLYAATFGWSVFRRLLNFDEVLKPVAIDGHMDLTDRIVTGPFTGDDYTLVTFADSRMLGPLHPIEAMAFAGDETMGNEIHVDLKLDFAWKTDFSVVVTVSATMIDRDDNEVDNHADTVVTVASGTAETVTIDFKSGELYPDRARIEFTVTNA